MSSLSDILGTNPQTCGHEFDANTSLVFVVPDESADWAFMMNRAAHSNPEVANATSIKVCSACQNLLPTTVRRNAEAREAAAARRQNAEDEREAKLAELEGETVYVCGDCDGLFGAEDLVQVRWCSHCEQSFNGTENGRNCENCNRPFTRKVTDEGCPDCVDSYDEDDDGKISVFEREA